MPLSEEQVRELSDKILDGHYAVEESVRMIADAVLEMAAKVAENTAEEAGPHNSWSKSGHTIADRIRSMKSGGA